MNWIKILNFIDGVFETHDRLSYGKLYKIKDEPLPFRYVYVKGDDLKKIHRFKHHNLKEYLFKDLTLIEREANKNEIRIYNLIKDHINNINDKKNIF